MLQFRMIWQLYFCNGRRQAIIWTNAGMLLISPQGTDFIEILFKMQKKFIRESAFEHVVCEIAAILPKGKGVNVSIFPIYCEKTVL